VGVGVPYIELRNPAHVIGFCVADIGEEPLLKDFGKFVDLVLSKSPYSPEFVKSLAKSPKISSKLSSDI